MRSPRPWTSHDRGAVVAVERPGRSGGRGRVTMSLVSNDGLSLTDAARRVGVTPATLRRWLRDGLIPQHDGNGWTTAALGQARVVARMRDRGHSLQNIRKASEEGRLAYAYADELFPESDQQYTLEEAAR